MEKVDFYRLFHQYEPSDPVRALIDSAELLAVNASRARRMIELQFQFFDNFDPDPLEQLRSEVQHCYQLQEVLMKVRCPADAFGPHSAPALLWHLQRRLPVSRGLLVGSQFSITAEAVTLRLQNGGAALLTEQGCERELTAFIQEVYGLCPKVTLGGITEITADEDYETRQQARLEQAAKAAGVGKVPDRKETKTQNSQALLGKPIREKPSPIGELTPETGRVTIQGDVFSTGKREIKNGSMIVWSMEITDYTGSIKVSRLFKKEELAFTDQIAVGSTVLVRGDVEFNRFEHDIVMRPLDIVPAEAEQVLDCAEHKRVELHLHTKMSAMDGMNVIGDYVKQAAAWGYQAIAVTDHGVVQAFPDAMKAGKQYGVKILYGVEDYFINDTVPAVFSPRNYPLMGEVIVFDLETTGLNAESEAITEIGAVRIENGQVKEEFCTFVDPERPIPQKITELTGITDQMVKGAPQCKEALAQFFAFCGDAPLVAHNAAFDTGFLKVHAARCGLPFAATVLDTLPLCRFLFPSLKHHRLNNIAEHLKLPAFRHHRASDDAKELAEIYFRLTEILQKENEVEDFSQINSALAGNVNVATMRPYHQILLVRTQAGMKNLYKLISASHLNYFYKKPRIPKSLLMQLRDGLLVGSACDAGELHIAVREGRPWNELKDIASFYDYLEIQPVGNSAHLVQEDRVENEEALREVNRKICRLGEALHIPVVATGDVHFLRPRDAIFREILMAGMGFSDAENQAPLYLRTTDDMLQEFSYLGEEKAYEVVVENPNRIAELCEKVTPINPAKCPPQMAHAEEDLREMCRSRAIALYGEPLPELVQARMDRELDCIIGNGYAVMYMIAQKLVQKSLSDGYLVGSRGSVGSSLAAYLSGITEVNALLPHYRCPQCRHSEFITDGSYAAGVDMPDRTCPNCGTPMKKDGFEIPFETFLGFEGDKEPDIDLNFSGEYQPVAHKYTETLFGEGYVFRAGTIGTLADKTAYGFVKKYLEGKGMVVSRAEENRLSVGCTGVKRTTGQHPGGVIICPKDHDIYDFCPVQHPADDVNSDIITTHFEYHAIDKNLLKLDILGHDDPTMIRMLEDLTGLDAKQIPLDDPDTMRIFTSPEPLGLTPDEVIGTVGTIAIPEFGTRFVRQMLEDTRPTTFAELVRISGLSHGTNVWVGNAQDLVRGKIATLSEVICTRDDIMGELIRRGLDKSLSFTIMEAVRKGKGLKPEWEEEMKVHEVPQWYIDSCNKISYMFPKAHAVAYVTMAYRIAYCKVHYPKAFYTAYFTVRADAFDAQYMTRGLDVVKAKMKEIEQLPDATAKEKDMFTVLEVCYEMYRRGISFCPIDLYESDPTRFQMREDGILPSLNAMQGLGASAAASIAQARAEEPFTSQEDLRIRAKISKAVLDTLAQSGVLGDLPESSQLCLF